MGVVGRWLGWRTYNILDSNMHNKPLSMTKLSSSQNKKTPKLHLDEQVLKTIGKNTPKNRLLINSPKRCVIPFQEETFFKKPPESTKASRPKKRKDYQLETTFTVDKSETRHKPLLALNVTKKQKQKQKQKSEEGVLKSNPITKSSNRLLSKPDHYNQLELKLDRLENRIITIKSGIHKEEKEDLKRSKMELKGLKVDKSELKESHRAQTKTRIFSEEKKPPHRKQNQNNNAALSTLVTQAHNKVSNNDVHQDPYSLTKGWYYISLVSKCYVSEHLPLVREHISQCLHTMKFMKGVKRPSDKQIEHKKVFLPQKEQHKGKLLVILDLDETLIHCNQSSDMKCDVLLPIKFPNGDSIQAGINIRPHCIQFLKLVSQMCEVIVFTASHSSYANVVLNHLDPLNEYISHRLYRDNCYQTQEGIFVKDLRIINRSLKKMILVDNAAYSYFFQMNNGVPIVPYYKGKNDYELRYLANYIYNLLNEEDVQEYNARYFRLEEYFQCKDAKSLIRRVYPEMVGEKKSL